MRLDNSLIGRVSRDRERGGSMSCLKGQGKAFKIHISSPGAFPSCQSKVGTHLPPPHYTWTSLVSVFLFPFPSPTFVVNRSISNEIA